MRPAGEIRLAALRVAADVAHERAARPVAGATQLDVLDRLVRQGVGRAAGRATWQNLVRAGQLQPVGKLRLPACPRLLVAYVPVGVAGAGGEHAPQQHRAAPDLASVVRQWPPMA